MFAPDTKLLEVNVKGRELAVLLATELTLLWLDGLDEVAVRTLLILEELFDTATDDDVDESLLADNGGLVLSPLPPHPTKTIDKDREKRMCLIMQP